MDIQNGIKDGAFDEFNLRIKKACDEMAIGARGLVLATEEAARKMNEFGRVLVMAIHDSTTRGDLNFQILRWERKQRHLERYQRMMARRRK
jgi:hypothetical protein